MLKFYAFETYHNETQYKQMHESITLTIVQIFIILLVKKTTADSNLQLTINTYSLLKTKYTHVYKCETYRLIRAYQSLFYNYFYAYFLTSWQVV